MEKLDPLETKLLDAVEVIDVDEDAAELEWLAISAGILFRDQRLRLAVSECGAIIR
jgi:hypothetical protein